MPQKATIVCLTLLCGLLLFFYLNLPRTKYTPTVHRDGSEVIGRFTIRKRWPQGTWTAAHASHTWYKSNGFIASRHGTIWNSDGQIVEQYTKGVRRTSGPWLNGETDQTEPTAPWGVAGKTFEEWWDSLPSAKKADSLKSLWTGPIWSISPR